MPTHQFVCMSSGEGKTVTQLLNNNSVKERGIIPAEQTLSWSKSSQQEVESTQRKRGKKVTWTGRQLKWLQMKCMTPVLSTSAPDLCSSSSTSYIRSFSRYLIQHLLVLSSNLHANCYQVRCSEGGREEIANTTADFRTMRVSESRMHAAL